MHRAAADALGSAAAPLILSPFVLAELDYFILGRLGQRQELQFLEEVGRGVYRMEAFTAADIDRAREVIRRYSDLDIGLADASIVVLAGRHGVSDVLTLDRRHFSALRTPTGQRFRILPTHLS